MICMIGQPFPAKILDAPKGQDFLLCEFFTDKSYAFILGIQNIKLAEVKTLETCRLEVGIIQFPPLINLVLHFVGFGVFICDFDSHLCDPFLPPPITSDKTRFLMQIITLDAGTKIVKGLRALTLSPSLSQEILLLAIAQRASPYTTLDYDKAMLRFQSLYSPTQLLGMAHMHPTGI